MAKTKEKKDRTFSPAGIHKELKRVRWPKLKTEGTEIGILSNTGSVIVFTAVFAAIFVLCNFAISKLLIAFGI